MSYIKYFQNLPLRVLAYICQEPDQPDNHTNPHQLESNKRFINNQPVPIRFPESIDMNGPGKTPVPKESSEDDPQPLAQSTLEASANQPRTSSRVNQSCEASNKEPTLSNIRVPHPRDKLENRAYLAVSAYFAIRGCAEIHQQIMDQLDDASLYLLSLITREVSPSLQKFNDLEQWSRQDFIQIFTHSEVVKYVCGKIYRVYKESTDDDLTQQKFKKIFQQLLNKLHSLLLGSGGRDHPGRLHVLHPVN